MLMQSIVYGPRHTKWPLLKEWTGTTLDCKKHDRDRAHCDDCAKTHGETWKMYTHRRDRMLFNYGLAVEFCKFRNHMNSFEYTLPPTLPIRTRFEQHPDWKRLYKGLKRCSVQVLLFPSGDEPVHKTVVLHYEDGENTFDYRRCFFPESHRELPPLLH
jgi:hypothetical protein